MGCDDVNDFSRGEFSQAEERMNRNPKTREKLDRAEAAIDQAAIVSIPDPVNFSTEEERMLRALAEIAARLGLSSRWGTDYTQKPGIGAFRYVQIGYNQVAE